MKSRLRADGIVGGVDVKRSQGEIAARRPEFKEIERDIIFAESNVNQREAGSGHMNLLAQFR